jgi:hypothetical protein
MSESSSEARNVIEVSDADMAAAAAEETAEESGEVSEETAGPFSQKTAWVRRMETPLRVFLRTETGSASVLAAATVLALIWANISISSSTGSGRPICPSPSAGRAWGSTCRSS